MTTNYEAWAQGWKAAIQWSEDNMFKDFDEEMAYQNPYDPNEDDPNE